MSIIQARIAGLFGRTSEWKLYEHERLYKARRDAADELYEALKAVELARHTDAEFDWERATKLTDIALAKAQGRPNQ